MQDLSLDFDTLQAAYRSGRATPTAVVREVLARISARGDDGVWIHRLPDPSLLAHAAALEALSERERLALPLYGLPFSVKDCIDVAGEPTTAACPAFAYVPTRTNLTVRRALDAGAILIGKTNMDQFATGVVGTRSPHGVARNPYDARYIPGGSSSGAAVSVSAGLCSFGFGSDTGGSGRVPASYNNIVGLKPTLGLFSRVDMVNASRHFDTISVYAANAADAARVLDACRAVDPLDPWGRALPADAGADEFGAALRIAVPAEPEFYGNADAAALFAEGVAYLRGAGHDVFGIDFDVFVETSEMMFTGPLIAERFAAVGAFVESNPDAVDPSVREVILSARRFSAADAFDCLYRLRENVAAIRRTFDAADIIAVPTVGTVYTVDEVAADPIATNATNGRYMNFVNMADLAAIAVPNGFLPSGVPMGITFVAPAFSDFRLARFGARFHAGRAATAERPAVRARRAVAP